jgi:hypothetical protein
VGERVEDALTHAPETPAWRSGDQEEERFRSLDVHALLLVMWHRWNEVFRQKFGQIGKTYVGELRDIRNRWAHQEPFSPEDTHRALDTMTRLLRLIGSECAAETDRMAQEALRPRFEQEGGREPRRLGGAAVTVSREALMKEVPTVEVLDSRGGRVRVAFVADLTPTRLPEHIAEFVHKVQRLRGPS